MTFIALFIVIPADQIWSEDGCYYGKLLKKKKLLISENCIYFHSRNSGNKTLIGDYLDCKGSGGFLFKSDIMSDAK